MLQSLMLKLAAGDGARMRSSRASKKLNPRQVRPHAGRGQMLEHGMAAAGIGQIGDKGEVALVGGEQKLSQVAEL